MAMFPQGSMIPLKSVESWVAYGDTRAKPAHLNAISRLVALHVIDYDKEKLEFVLNSSFRERLLDAVVSFGMVDSSEGGQQQDAEARSVIPIPVNELEEYAKLSWERLLHFIIGVKKFPEEMEMANMIQLLCKLGVLSADSGSSGNYSIGKEGYKFLFKDLHSQLWTLLIGYLDNCTDEVTRTELLTFIFRLGFLRIGKDYSRRTMKKSENNLVIELWNLGLLYMKKKNSSRFFVTPLAKFLTTRAGTGVGLNIDTGVSVSNPEETEEKERGFIIIETSFKFYAYTNSELQKTLIKLFVNVQALLPNMIVGKITKKSIRKAISMGISSSEILHYMETNLHPEMIKAGASFPNNVAGKHKFNFLSFNPLYFPRSNSFMGR
jgi:transcription initiation factor TFIIH subunit 4